ncbi:SRPBCC family protein [Actinocorallia populi]|uniref:SRPBCC family protein n=1 Tax=Actinocorallia populi TaxID=2079200 RepID=UPI000D08EA53|nr:SRPBCC family protein [Actinocorallia populi]
MADRTSSSITIKADKAAIMEVIADYPSYPDWADGIKSAQVLSAHPDGRPELVRMTLASGPISDTYTVRCHWSGDDELRWDLAEAGAVVSGMNGSYTLTGVGGGTEVVYELAVDVKIPMIGMFRRKAEKIIIDAALKGLKRQVEK